MSLAKKMHLTSLGLPRKQLFLILDDFHDKLSVVLVMKKLRCQIYRMFLHCLYLLLMDEPVNQNIFKLWGAFCQ